MVTSILWTLKSGYTFIILLEYLFKLTLTTSKFILQKQIPITIIFSPIILPQLQHLRHLDYQRLRPYKLDTNNFPLIRTIIQEFPRFVYLQTIATTNLPLLHNIILL